MKIYIKRGLYKIITEEFKQYYSNSTYRRAKHNNIKETVFESGRKAYHLYVSWPITIASLVKLGVEIDNKLRMARFYCLFFELV